MATRKPAAKKTPAKRAAAKPVAAKSVKEALELTITALTKAKALTATHEAIVATARGLAGAVESDPTSAALWREFRAAVSALTSLAEGTVPDESQEFADAVRAPVGDSS